MFPYFVASGQILFDKCARLYLQSISKLIQQLYVKLPCYQTER